MSLRILLHPPHLNLKDKKYLNNTIAENWISTAGPNIKLFENKIKKYTNSKYCVALSSGTSALHLALKVLGVKKDDEVIVPSLTFIATINPIRYLYANPIFMDSDKYFNLDFEYDKFRSSCKPNNFYRLVCVFDHTCNLLCSISFRFNCLGNYNGKNSPKIWTSSPNF